MISISISEYGTKQYTENDSIALRIIENKKYEPYMGEYNDYSSYPYSPHEFSTEKKNYDKVVSNIKEGSVSVNSCKRGNLELNTFKTPGINDTGNLIFNVGRNLIFNVNGTIYKWPTEAPKNIEDTLKPKRINNNEIELHWS